MTQEKGNNQFHDSESEDVGDVLFDLYNACNGVLDNGMLDIQKLDELSEEESKVLDIPKLKEFGAHIVSGCAECGAIIETLNSARASLKSTRLRAQAVNANPSDS